MNNTQRYIREFEVAYMAHINPPAPTGNAKVIAKWPTQQKSTLTVIQYRCKGVNYRVW